MDQMSVRLAGLQRRERRIDASFAEAQHVLAETHEARLLIRWACAGLTPTQKAAIVMEMFPESYTHNSAGKSFGLSRGAVFMARANAFKKIRTKQNGIM